jgi:cytochrome c oxidase subunit 2
MNDSFELFPKAGSTTAPMVDAIYLFMVFMSLAITIAVAALVLYFCVKYRRAANVDRTQGPASIRNELIWMASALPVLLFIFVWGTIVAFAVLRPPAGAMPITVVAKQWMWKFQHDDGRREIDELHVPINQPVLLTMISQDVIHSFFVPGFRVKQDVLPGRYTTLWFNADTPGEYRLYCAEYCGTDHSRMIGRIIVQTPADHAAWLAGATSASRSPSASGAELFAQYQCATCHLPEGQRGRGPTLAGIHGQRMQLASGEQVLVDDDYLRESILRPSAKVVANYQPIMPVYENQLSEENVLELIAYIKSLSNTGGEPKQ